MKQKKIPALILVAIFIALLIPVITAPASAVSPVHNTSDEYLVSQYYANLKSVTLTGDQRTDVVLVALSQLGYHEGNSEAEMGGGNTSGTRNFVEFNRLFGKLDNDEGNGVSYGYAWCAAFATWSIRTAGVPVSILKTEVSCIRLIDWLKSYSTYNTRQSGYVPEKGDLIFFKSPTSTAISTHVGIVRYVSGSTVYTIEGNTSSECVSLRSYELTDTYIVGYGVPAYASNPSKAIDFSMAGGYLTGTYFVNTATLNVRSGPSTSYENVGSLYYGMKVTVLSVSSGWGKIRLDGRDGWIYLGYAQYVPSARYTIFYNVNGGSPVVPAQPKADGVSTKIVADTPVKNGYNFIGWSTKSDATTAEYIAGSAFTADADTTLYAVFTVGDFTVNFYNGETLLMSGSFKNGAEATQPSAPVKDPDNTYNYTFAGWDADSDGKADIKAGDKITVTSNAKYYAVFDKNYIDYKVTFYARDGVTVISEKAYHYGDPVVIPQVSGYREGPVAYTFAGWNTAVAPTVTANTSYTAVFNEGVAIYSVSFIDGNGSVMSEGEYRYGETVKLPETTPVKNADETYTYTFTGWSAEPGAVLDDMVYTAQFTGTYIEYSVSFIDGDGITVSEISAHYGDTVTAPEAAPGKTSDQMYEYRFTGWDNEIKPVSGNIKYTALFESVMRVYTVTFFNADGTVYKTASYNYGDVIELPANPVRTSSSGTYTFTGWKPEVTPVTGNMNFTAQYSFKANETPGQNDDSGSFSAGTIISIAVVLLAAAAFITYIVIRGKREKHDEP